MRGQGMEEHVFSPSQSPSCTLPLPHPWAFNPYVLGITEPSCLLVTGVKVALDGIKVMKSTLWSGSQFGRCAAAGALC